MHIKYVLVIWNLLLTWTNFRYISYVYLYDVYRIQMMIDISRTVIEQNWIIVWIAFITLPWYLLVLILNTSKIRLDATKYYSQ